VTTFSLSNLDAVAWLERLPSGSVSLAITDPPYESLEKHRAIGTTTRLKHSKASSNDWFAIFPNARFDELFTQLYRVLAKNSHLYLFCDPETMFVAKPAGERAGFKFWKPLIWDKCLGPDTLVWTERGVVRIADIQVGDRVALPEGGTTAIKAVRQTRAPALRVTLSDGTKVIASRDHRFVRGNNTISAAKDLAPGDTLCVRNVRERIVKSLDVADIIPDEDTVYQLPTTSCLWCGRVFDGSRAAAAHQARWCDEARSKVSMAREIGIKPKRLRRWMGRGRIPRAWARALGIEELGGRVQTYLQNDAEIWYPRSIWLDHELGKIIGLYAAEGSLTSAGIQFALHREEKHLHNAIARFARSLGIRAQLEIREPNAAVVNVSFKIARYLIQHFVGGTNARNKYLKPTVFAAPDEFRRGVLEGLIEGDGHWNHTEQRERYASASPDLSSFVLRELLVRGKRPMLRRVENAHAGAWVVEFDPIQHDVALTVTAIEDVGEQDLVDVAVTDRDELFLLANGLVTHNCRIGMGYHYRARYECVLFFEKGKRKLANLGLADIIQAPRVIDGYPAEKPVSVSEILVQQSSTAGELVIDPFMGSGSAGVAAARHGRAFMGNDLCREAVEITERRLIEAGATPVEAENPVGAGQTELAL